MVSVHHPIMLNVYLVTYKVQDNRLQLRTLSLIPRNLVIPVTNEGSQ